MSQTIEQVTAEELKELIESGEKVVCDFYATWCGPCRMLAPVMDEMAVEFFDKVKFVKMDIDDNEEFAMSLGIYSIPDVFFFEEGKVKDHRLGFGDRKAMQAFIRKNL